MSNLFDFTDTSDLSADLQKRLAGGGRVNPNIVIYANIVKAGNAAGLSAISISMIEAVASRMSLPSISQQAIRNALTGAVKAGLIVKVTRQTYGVVTTFTEADEGDEGDAGMPVEAVADTDEAPVDVTDPLA
jgi:hypothetical protein